MLPIKDIQSGCSPGLSSSRPVPITKAIQHERAQDYQLRHIVCLLMDALDIPDGSQYAVCFGGGGGTDNREALTTWVRQMLTEIGPELTEEGFLALRYRLNRRLSAARFENQAHQT